MLMAEKRLLDITVGQREKKKTISIDADTKGNQAMGKT